ERVGDDLQRDVATELRVARAIDLAHAAGAEGREDLVRADSCPRDKAHGFCAPTQFTMIVIGEELVSSARVLIRNRWPSADTRYCSRLAPSTAPPTWVGNNPTGLPALSVCASGTASIG